MRENKEQTRAAVKEFGRERVTPIRVLYYWYPESKVVVEVFQRRLNRELERQKHDINFRIKLIPDIEMHYICDEVCRGWDVIIMHLSAIGEIGDGRGIAANGVSRLGAYRAVDKVRDLSDAILVAESFVFPEGKDEVLQHFDYYIPQELQCGSFVPLFKKLKYIPGRFNWRPD